MGNKKHDFSDFYPINYILNLKEDLGKRIFLKKKTYIFQL